MNSVDRQNEQVDEAGLEGRGSAFVITSSSVLQAAGRFAGADGLLLEAAENNRRL